MHTCTRAHVNVCACKCAQKCVCVGVRVCMCVREHAGVCLGDTAFAHDWEVKLVLPLLTIRHTHRPGGMLRPCPRHPTHRGHAAHGKRRWRCEQRCSCVQARACTFSKEESSLRLLRALNISTTTSTLMLMVVGFLLRKISQSCDRREQMDEGKLIKKGEVAGKRIACRGAPRRAAAVACTGEGKLVGKGMALAAGHLAALLCGGLGGEYDLGCRGESTAWGGRRRQQLGGEQSRGD